MSNEQRLNEILETILETGCEPAEACAGFPELLPEVQQRLEQVRRVQQQLSQLFPDSKDSESSHSAQSRMGVGRLPTIAGYVIDSVLGSGGMGVVYKARHEKLNRVVALKMLRAGHFATNNELTRFAREFQAIAELHCHHIVQIYDVGDADGRPFFTMEFVDGGSLAERLQGTPQPAASAAELVAQLAEAIHSAHERGIIHRDLKPANILLSQEGLPKIADFGLARHMECDQPLTNSGVQLGTPSYMAPEQALGASDDLGPAVDLYALGAILYEMLTGRPPFRAESALETQRQVLQVEPVPPSRINASVPRDLETICLTCLNKDPQRRYASASALAADLRRFLRHEPIEARPISRAERGLRWMRRNLALTALTCTGLALAALAVTFAVREAANSKQRQLEAEKWKQRLGFVTRLEQAGRFNEARAILSSAPDVGSRELRAQVERAESELDLAECLDAIRMSRGKFTQGGGIDYLESDRSYAKAFREAGIGSPHEDSDAVAKQIGRSTVRASLIAALDDWAACAGADTRAWILAVARTADPDPWRDLVRDQSNWADLDHLNRLADAVDIEHQPVTLLASMGTRWRRLSGDPKEFLQRVHHQYPGDFWLNFELAMAHERDDPAACLAHNLAALAVRPDAAGVHFNTGIAYEHLQNLDEARFHFARTIQLDSEHAWAEYRLAINLFNSGQERSALDHFRRALTLDSKFNDARNGLRIALIKLGQLQEAALVWEASLNDPTTTHQDVDGIAELMLVLGQKDKYHWACAEMLKRFGSTDDALVCERLGRACLLSPTSIALNQQASELIKRARNAELPESQRWAKPFILFADALRLYREGEFNAVLELLNGEASTVLQPAPDLLRALALRRLNQPQSAQEALSRAEEQLRLAEPMVNREAWLSQILHREAVKVLTQND